MDILNKTQRPLRVPLPGGKKLFLSPGKTGQVSPKAAEHPPLKALIEAGDIEVQGKGKSKGASQGSGKGVSSSEGHSSGGGVRHTGDR